MGELTCCLRHGRNLCTLRHLPCPRRGRSRRRLGRWRSGRSGENRARRRRRHGAARNRRGNRHSAAAGHPAREAVFALRPLPRTPVSHRFLPERRLVGARRHLLVRGRAGLARPLRHEQYEPRSRRRIHRHPRHPARHSRQRQQRHMGRRRQKTPSSSTTARAGRLSTTASSTRAATAASTPYTPTARATSTSWVRAAPCCAC